MVELFNSLLQIGLDPSARTYVTLMRAYQSLGAYSRARGAYAAADAAGKRTTAATNLLVAILVDAQNLPEASDTVAALSANARTAPEAQALLPGFAALAGGLAKEGRAAECVALLRRFTQLGGSPDEQLFDVVLRCCVRCGEVCRNRSLHLLRRAHAVLVTVYLSLLRLAR